MSHSSNYEIDSVPKEGPYSIDRAVLAQMCAAHVSSNKDAVPEAADFDNAEEMLKLLEVRLRWQH